MLAISRPMPRICSCRRSRTLLREQDAQAATSREPRSTVFKLPQTALATRRSEGSAPRGRVMGNGATAVAGAQPAQVKKPAKKRKNFLAYITESPPWALLILLCIVANAAILG